MNFNEVKKNNFCTITTSCCICSEFLLCNSWNSFLLNLSQKNKYNGKPKALSAYSHFDKKCSLLQMHMKKYVVNKNNIVSHSFYPFIHYTKTTKKFDSDAGKSREIFYSSHKDKCVYQRYSFLLNYYYNKMLKDIGIENVPIAYRTDLNKNNINFAKTVFDFIKSTNTSKIIVGDFSSFFDTLNHKYLKKMMCKVLDTSYLPEDYYSIYKNISNFSYFEWDDLIKIREYKHHRGILKKMNSLPRIISKEQFKENVNLILPQKKDRKLYGIPQGSPISAVLSNIYMLDFDVGVNYYIKKLNGLYLRYSDDFIIVIPDSKNKEDIFSFIENMVQSIDEVSCPKKQGGLSLNTEKTHILKYQNQKIYNSIGEHTFLDYLGFIFDGQITKVRRKSIGKYYYRMHRKAKSIKRSNGRTKNNKTISYKNIYRLYSSSSDKRTYIDYLKSADKIINLQSDNQSQSLIKNNKAKIRLAIKK